MIVLIEAQMSTGWYVGFIVGALVVVVVAVLVILLATLASRIASRAAETFTALEHVQQATASLHKVDDVNNSAVRVLEGAVAARRTLTGG
ncbi:MAG: hypothetical protein ACR2KD_04285 [Thermoleophilaceae bacterium]|jgi:cell division septation protein DedD|nr:hypothetical protein [Thermoleophilaceae bacterium]